MVVSGRFVVVVIVVVFVITVVVDLAFVEGMTVSLSFSLWKPTLELSMGGGGVVLFVPLPLPVTFSSLRSGKCISGFRLIAVTFVSPVGTGPSVPLSIAEWLKWATGLEVVVVEMLVDLVCEVEVSFGGVVVRTGGLVTILGLGVVSRGGFVVAPGTVECQNKKFEYIISDPVSHACTCVVDYSRFTKDCAE